MEVALNPYKADMCNLFVYAGGILQKIKQGFLCGVNPQTTIRKNSKERTTSKIGQWHY